MTSVKRRIVAFVGAVLLTTTMAMGVSAVNKYKPTGSDSNGVIAGNPRTKSTTTNGNYGWMYGNYNQTKMTTNQNGKTHGYTNCYKVAKFYPWEYVSGDFELITTTEAQKQNSGTSVTVSTATITPAASWDKRSNVGYLYNYANTQIEYHYSNVVAENHI